MSTLQKINNLFEQVRICLMQKQSLLPFVKYQKSFDFTLKKYVLNNPSKLIFNRKSLRNTLRFIQILKIVVKLLTTNKLITKRSLYYELVKYYPVYAKIDIDLQVICDTLKTSRQKLNIIASNKLLICGNLTLLLDDKDGLNHQKTVLQCKQTSFVNLPNCKTIKIGKIQADKIIIVQKQSIFYKLCQQKQKYPNSLIITSRGYPDNLTRQFLQQVKQTQLKIYYLGDYDIYGIDVMLTYAFGTRHFGLADKLNWLQIYDLVSESNQNLYPEIVIPKSKFQQEYLPFQKQDQTKGKELLERQEFRLLDSFQPKNQEQQFFKHKLLKWQSKIKEMIKIGRKVELQSFFKFQQSNPNIVNFLIQNKICI